MTAEMVEEAEQELEPDSTKTIRRIAVERRWD